MLAAPHFVLVEGVAAETAEALVRRATAAGYRAEIDPPVRAERARRWPARGRMPSLVEGVLAAGWVVSLAASATSRDGWLAVAVLLAATLLTILLGWTLRRSLRQSLPVAYTDLAAAVLPQAAVTPTAPDPGPERRSGNDVEALAVDVMADFAELDGALDALGGSDPAPRDPQQAARDRRLRAVGLVVSARRRHAAVSAGLQDIEIALADLARYRARLLVQAHTGRVVESEEVALLDATIAEHEQELEERVREAQLLTRDVAQLLDLRAEAARARRTLGAGRSRRIVPG